MIPVLVKDYVKFFFFFCFIFEKISCVLWTLHTMYVAQCIYFVFCMPLRKWELSFGWFKSNATQITTKWKTMNKSLSIDRQKKEFEIRNSWRSSHLFFCFFVCICVYVIHKLETFLDLSRRKLQRIHNENDNFGSFGFPCPLIHWIVSNIPTTEAGKKIYV